jgi:hypothetical protein
MHNSVKLLQTLSAFLRNCLSVTPPFTPMLLAPLDIGPGCPTLPIIADNARASLAAVSKAVKTSWPTRALTLMRAESSWDGASRCDDVVLAASPWAPPAPDPRFGDPDMVVAFVVAVGGRSSEALDIAAPEVAGIFPVSSKRLIRDFKSSNSSQTVEGAAVDDEDSVPSAAAWFVSVLWMGSSF